MGREIRTWQSVGEESCPPCPTLGSAQAMLGGLRAVPTPPNPFSGKAGWQDRCHLLQPSVADEGPQQLPGQDVPVLTPNPSSHPCHEAGHHCPGCAAGRGAGPSHALVLLKEGLPTARGVQRTDRLFLPGHGSAGSGSSLMGRTPLFQWDAHGCSQAHPSPWDVGAALLRPRCLLPTPDSGLQTPGWKMKLPVLEEDSGTLGKA